jgi:gluconolactonase
MDSGGALETVSREIEFREVASGLQFPEGPITLPDGSVALVEIARGTLSRIDVETGAIDVIADCGGGPNGAAVGPDGQIYVTNNGGFFEWTVLEGPITFPGATPSSHTGGSIQRVDPATGAVETLYTECDGRTLVAPNDLVLDAHGGIWFTDHGVQGEATADRPGLLYATTDGSSIRGMAYGTHGTNGVGLSPAGDRVYVAETHGCTLWEWDVPSPGTIGPLDESSDRSGGRLLYRGPDGSLFDSLAVDGDGWIAVGTLGRGGVTAVAPDGSAAEHIPLPDPLVTNMCFGGPGHGSDDHRTAYATCSTTGKLVAFTWPRRGLALAH